LQVPVGAFIRLMFPNVISIPPPGRRSITPLFAVS
jgi:hypothetical protein